MDADLPTMFAADALSAQPPAFSDEQAADMALRLFGIAGTATSLGSERDQNFRVTDDDGRSFVLKISNRADDPAVVDLQTQAALHIASTDPELPVGRPIPTADGAYAATAVGAPDSTQHLVRMSTFVDGDDVDGFELPFEALAPIAATAARVGQALRGFFHAAAGRTLLWDLKHAAKLRPLIDSVEDERRRALVTMVMDRFERRVLPVFDRLRAQIIHNDLALSNLLIGPDGRVTGIIDFGDIAHSALVCDFVATLASLVRGRQDPWESARAAIAGYQSVTPLDPNEAALLSDLLAARLATTVVISAWRVRRYPENREYITGWDADSWQLLDVLDEAGPDRATRRLQQMCSATPDGDRSVTWSPREATSDGELLARRLRVLGGGLAPLSYSRPLHLVRAEGVWMFDAEGQAFLDAYNNVPVVGHCHPRVTEAVSLQVRTLNTNTRYLHEHVVELAERITASLPRSLDTCVFVNSGSEANDLAWRLATCATGRAGGIVTAHAYHGVSTAIAALSPEDWAEGEHPDHVETIPAADGYRGRYRREDPEWAERTATHLHDAVEALARRGFEPAMVLIDSALTSDGILDPPGEYLRALSRRARDAGALLVADEVQAGFGRSGSGLWSFADSGVTPDIVTLGKPMGNGHPVAAVVTSSEVIERYTRDRGEFFSTFGGNPVACAAALAVLDVLEEERLIEHTAGVGADLRSKLAGLADRHAAIGDVRGRGLLLGVELVVDRSTREPATRATAAVVDGMAERGVLIGSAGPDGNVLKIRPPLVLAAHHVDGLVAALDDTLRTLED